MEIMVTHTLAGVVGYSKRKCKQRSLIENPIWKRRSGPRVWITENTRSPLSSTAKAVSAGTRILIPVFMVESEFVLLNSQKGVCTP